jgi:hypothetical protein
MADVEDMVDCWRGGSGGGCLPRVGACFESMLGVQVALVEERYWEKVIVSRSVSHDRASKWDSYMMVLGTYQTFTFSSTSSTLQGPT